MARERIMRMWGMTDPLPALPACHATLIAPPCPPGYAIKPRTEKMGSFMRPRHEQAGQPLRFGKDAE